ncbi:MULTISPECIES: sulfotransferase [Streptomyces]|uniref:Sulfotransferase family protein n=1 Tax=Streptomyces venezuelae TaxID=54571 RepID=A0A5P2BFM4_STRVZ|nr:MULTISPECIES: sulfotransferase [Streptomyces]NEA00260.1 sulfotransferase [Streptomyces sp. SID10116]MYY87406.1 sulfotransferase family protein [Streptomyces sp. SID335]MYZ17020.1 sulfotransferase family protein [Streptomyces sp. SID337]NDZ89736.1 sulfotransferase [Streptomyces sp. SID10115]NEB45478.1 sulfotransferase [Streptomyces sp. SID339]
MNDSPRGGSSGEQVIALWSAPRSRSTAFLRMMMGRDDVAAVHEPFSRLADFGSAEIEDRTVHSEAELIDAITTLGGKSRLFFKDTTDFHYPGVLADQDFLRNVCHTFIIRDPKEVIASHFALNPELRRDEVGFARLHELFLAVTEAQGAEPVVVDSDDLIERPEDTVRAYCESVGLPFDATSLSWSPGMPDDWKLTARWHQDASTTNGFVKSRKNYPDTVDNHPVLAEHYRAELPFYTYLHERRLRPRGAVRGAV